MKFQHELVFPNEDLPFKLFVFEGKDGNYIRERHWHRSIEIFAVFDGELRFFVNEEAYSLCAGEFMLLNSNEVHSVVSLKKNITIVLQIPLDVFSHYYTEENYICFSHGACMQDEAIMKLIREMDEIYTKKAQGYEVLVQSKFYKLVYLMVTQYRKTNVDEEDVKRNKRLNRLSAITKYIRKHYAEELSLEQVAKKFGYSPTHLSHMFTLYAQMNYKHYVQSVRMEYAYQDLIKTSQTINQIAEKHGFASNKAFSKVFQKKYGMLPSAYRKEHSL